MKFFTDCKTIDDVKRRYRLLCKEYHPDLHGSATEETMKQINAEYETAFNRYKNIHETADSTQQTYTKETAETPEQFRNIINELINCDGIDINIVGSWIWLTGSTFKHKDKIKAIGFKWANQKKAWYWHSDEYTSHRSRMTLDEIKSKYGCETVHTNSRKAIATA